MNIGAWVGAALVGLLATGGAALAIDGGALARPGDALARAAVGLGTIGEGEGGLGLTRCSGVLIAPDLVLTADHCVRNDPRAALVAFYRGSRPVPPFYPVRAIARFGVSGDEIPAEFLDPLRELSLDTAVLRLAAPVPGRTPLRLAAFRRDRLPSSLRLAGVGLSREGAGTLKTVALRPVIFSDTGLTIAKTDGARICSGDSGGPVIAQTRSGPVLWGVASAILTRTPPCGTTVVIAPPNRALGR